MNAKKMDGYYMGIARMTSELSVASVKVGVVVVKEGNIIAFGWNGTPSGFPNECEDDKGDTLPWVVHAEANAMAKLARSTTGCEGGTLYTTLSPCYDCAKMIVQAGISRVVYLEKWKKPEPIHFLEMARILCEKFTY